MENENEDLDSLNQEDVESENDKPADDADALKKKYEELSDKNRKLFERAKKAEGDLKELKTKIPEKKPEEILDKSQSNEPDYAKLAFLETKGFNHPDDQKWIQDEAARLKLPLTDILNMAHAKSYLETTKTQREAIAGMPKGRGSAGGQAQSDVDYWLQKGETPDDQELAEKVIEARIKKEQNKNKFSDELYTG